MADSLFQQNRFIFIIAGIMVAMALLYFAYRLAEGAFVSEQEASGTVVGKDHVPFHEEYRLQNVGGVNRNLKIAVPDAWYLEIDLGGPHARAKVGVSEFNITEPGAVVRIKYRKLRLSGNIQVTQYLGKEGG